MHGTGLGMNSGPCRLMCAHHHSLSKSQRIPNIVSNSKFKLIKFGCIFRTLPTHRQTDEHILGQKVAGLLSIWLIRSTSLLVVGFFRSLCFIHVLFLNSLFLCFLVGAICVERDGQIATELKRERKTKAKMK